MDKTTLVAADVEAGEKILGLLDESRLQITCAMWLYASEYEDWRFLLSSVVLDKKEPAKAYGLVHDTLDRAGFPLERTPSLLILRASDPFIKALRQIFGKARSVHGMRLGGQLIGDRFIQDAIVYRIQ